MLIFLKVLTMLFNSYIFIFFFLPLSFFVYFYLNKLRLTKVSKIFLVCASLFFYSWWNLDYLPLIIGSIFFNYLISKLLINNNYRSKIPKKIYLVFGIFANIMLLGYFKYADFFIENCNFFFTTNFQALNLLLPLAISFFTFQQIGYLVDSYNREINENDFLNYSLFVSFFPQLIAGPIVHHKEMMPQFANIRNKIINYKNISIGLFIFVIGLFKKVVIADTFSFWVSAGFDSAINLNFFEAWLTSLSYSCQLYFDFSGYVDMAIGAALLFNIKLPINFNSPYKSTNIQDFWRRWHITLSRFLKEYIYLPLGGNKRSELRACLNLMATFIIGGFWHGAGWLFIFWGFLHGFALIVLKFWKQLNLEIWSWVSIFITFNFVNFTWIFFRATKWSDALKVVKGMLSFKDIELLLNNQLSFSVFNNLDPQIAGFKFEIIKLYKFILRPDINIFIIFSIAFALFITFVFPNSYQLSRNFKPNILYSFTVVFLLFMCVIFIDKNSEFLYFNF